MAGDSNTYYAIINALPEYLPPDPARDAKINKIVGIKKKTCLILIGIFAGIATASVILRIILNLRNRRRLFADDYLVLFATVCLLVETGTYYHILDMAYIARVVAANPMNIMLFTRGQILELLKVFLNWGNVYLVFAWTTNYTIKMSFLAFFRPLLVNVSRPLNIYWWFVVAFTVASWIFNVIENFILCGVGSDTTCQRYPKHNFEMGIASTLADVITDLMIVSIPIFLLRHSRLQLSHKLRILAFLCLSIVMVALAIVRVVGAFYRDYAGVLVLSLTWSHLWLHIESSVAVLMGGVTAFRTVFARQSRRDDPRLSQKWKSSFLYGYIVRILGKDTLGGSGEVSDGSGRKKELLNGPMTGASMKGLRTFIRRNGREPGQTTIEDLEVSLCDPVENYHDFKRKEDRNHAGSGRVSTGENSNNEDYELQERSLPDLQTHNLT